MRIGSSLVPLVESWTFRLKGAPPELLQRTTMYNRLINSPFSVVGHDDLQAYRGIQAGLHASGNEWVSLHRNFDPSETAGGEITTVGTSELPMRNQFAAWREYMLNPPAVAAPATASAIATEAACEGGCHAAA